VRPPALRERLPLIERYRERLPLAADAPIVTLMEGSTPLVHAPRLSERLEIETHLKFEGMNPTGSF
jgi:threonine synthase